MGRAAPVAVSTAAGWRWFARGRCAHLAARALPAAVASAPAWAPKAVAAVACAMCVRLASLRRCTGGVTPAKMPLASKTHVVALAPPAGTPSGVARVVTAPLALVGQSHWRTLVSLGTTQDASLHVRACVCVCVSVRAWPGGGPETMASVHSAARGCRALYCSWSGTHWAGTVPCCHPFPPPPPHSSRACSHVPVSSSVATRRRDLHCQARRGVLAPCTAPRARHQHPTTAG